MPSTFTAVIAPNQGHPGEGGDRGGGHRHTQRPFYTNVISSTVCIQGDREISRGF